MREVLNIIRLRSPGALSYQYRKLEARGYLRREAGRPRTVEVRLPGEPVFFSEAVRPGPPPGSSGPGADQGPGYAQPERVVWVPIWGRIAAGGPILAQAEPVIDYMPLPREVVGSAEDLFILEVVGDSMTGAGIFSGDWVVVRRLFQPPRDGDIVAATIDGIELEGTVKTYRKVGRQVWLMPNNPAYTPVSGRKAQFAGKVIAVVRRI
jgi:repressor LexA